MEEQLHAKENIHAIAHAPESPMWSQDTSRDVMPVARDGERLLSYARGNIAGAPIGNTNARKHGLYSAEAIAEQREIVVLIRSMRRLVKEVDTRD